MGGKGAALMGWKGATLMGLLYFLNAAGVVQDLDHTRIILILAYDYFVTLWPLHYLPFDFLLDSLDLLLVSLLLQLVAPSPCWHRHRVET